MAITIEGYSVVAQRNRIQHLLDDDKIPLPNATPLADDHLWRCCFMAMDDAAGFARALELLGLNTSLGPDSDVVIVSEFDGSIDPYCEWLQTAKFEKAVIAWLVGTDPCTVVACEGWDPMVGSGLTFRSGTEGLELVRVEDNVEVYRDRETGEEVYLGRTSTPINSLYESATKIILDHWRNVGENRLPSVELEPVARAVAMLDKVLAEVGGDSRVHWLQGKGYSALGNLSAAYDSFQRAYALEKNEQTIVRELAGVCLELGKFEQAVEIAEAAVSLHPDNHELLSNLAVAHLLAGDVAAAQKTIVAAIKFSANDPINRYLYTAIDDVATGKRLPPESLQELQRIPPAPRSPKKFWQFWKK